MLDWLTLFLAGEAIAFDEGVFPNIDQPKIAHRLTCWLLPHLWGAYCFCPRYIGVAKP
jgi:hypothetical protein